MSEKKKEVKPIAEQNANAALDYIGDQLMITNEWLTNINEGITNLIARFDIFSKAMLLLLENKIPETPTATKVKKPGLKYIDTESWEDIGNSYKVTNNKGQVAFIGKSLIDFIEDKRLHFSKKAQKWFTEDKIKWQEDKYKK